VGSSTGRVKPKTITLVFVASPLQHSALRKRSKEWLAWNQDNVSEWATCLSVDCCFSELAL